MAYCNASDLHSHGVARGATPNPGRPLASLTSSTCVLDAHDFETGDAILLSVVGDGALPSPLVAGTTYYAQRESEHAFKVRATAGGSALTIVDADDTVLVSAPLDRDAAIELASRMVDDMTPGQSVPFDNAAVYPDGVPAIVRMTTAEIASGLILTRAGTSSRGMSEIVDGAQKRLARWAQGLPVRGTPAASRTNSAAPAPATAPVSDSRGWRRFGGIE